MPRLNQGEFDYIIIGAGSAGCVLANRLSANPHNRVLVLEAGERDNNWLLHIPIGIAKILPSGRYNWNYMSEPEPHADNTEVYHPRGKVLGGSSSINLMAYVRGHRGDYDRWRQKGLDGWSYDDVLPYFKRSEGFAEGADEYHGADGPLSVTQVQITDPFFKQFFDAGRVAGHPVTEDYNGAQQEGFAAIQTTTRNGKRCSASVGYLHPIEHRPNLAVRPESHVTQLLFEGTRVVGVEYIQHGQTMRVVAEGEVLLSGGAINSPQMLMLSGVGPADHLKSHGIDPLVDLPGVGQDLQDHPSVLLQYKRNTLSDFHRNLRLDRLALSMIQSHLWGTGFASTNPAQTFAFLKSQPDLELPDVQVFLRHGLTTAHEWFPGFKPPSPDGFVVRTCQLRPESRGFVELASSDPFVKAKMQNNFLSTETDRRVIRESVKMARDIVAQEPFQGNTGAELLPGDDVKTDAEIDAYIRETITTVFHPACTCRMGIDDRAVVDKDFKVRGLEGVRVIDASAMPDMVGGNINAPIIMMAEKASDVILGNPPA